MIIDITALNTFINAAKTDIAAIQRVFTVVDESQVVQMMKAHKIEDNQILMAVVPEYNTAGSRDFDSVQSNNYLAFLILEKINYRGLTHDEELQVWQRTLETAQAVQQKILNMASGVEDECPQFRFLEPGSFRMEPVWKLAECNGWILTVNVRK